ncbi:MAG: hypothetical protein M3R00_10895, partial [Pseudomonadota bacterium]|nr:hypothetical protein [Pseudomonadota bacterium]
PILPLTQQLFESIINALPNPAAYQLSLQVNETTQMCTRDTSFARTLFYFYDQEEAEAESDNFDSDGDDQLELAEVSKPKSTQSNTHTFFADDYELAMAIGRRDQQEADIRMKQTMQYQEINLDDEALATAIALSLGNDFNY